jgi:hypothetical protein
MRDEFEKWWLSRGYNPQLLQREAEGYRDGTAQIAYFAYCKDALASREGESSPQAAVPDVGAIIDYAIENDWCYPHECAIEDRVLDVRAVGKLKALLSAGKGGEA